MGINSGRILRVAGPVVVADGLPQARIADVVRVGEANLIGEVIRLSGSHATLQVYEDTAGLRVGEPVVSTGAPLQARLGPGLLGQVYDGLQRPLQRIRELAGDWVVRGAEAAPLAEDQLWQVEPRIAPGDLVRPGDILGVVGETPAVEHRIMVPPGVEGRVHAIHSGELTIRDLFAVIELDGQRAGELFEVRLSTEWPVRQARPFQRKLTPRQPLLTGTRVLDTLFPIGKGSTAAMPGGFGTGKTVLEQTLARWADIDVVVYVGCGERGNEMADVLREFPALKDLRTGRPLMERTILIANTSNMPVAARESSIYLGATIAEYFRDMGYDVLLVADSTSRWAEAMREVSSRLEEIPAEASFPAYLPARLSEFYERAGQVSCLGKPLEIGQQNGRAVRLGSLTIVGAVSPPGGDFSEPVTQSSLRVVGALWALDYGLSRRRHFPALSWTDSYSLYQFDDWFAEKVAPDWAAAVGETRTLLQRAGELERIVELVGPEALPERDRLLLRTAQRLREDFLQQSPFVEHDQFCPPEKSYWMLKAILAFHNHAQRALLAGSTLEQALALPAAAELARAKELPASEAVTAMQALTVALDRAFANG